MGKTNSTSHLPEDMLHGIVFPKPSCDELEDDDAFKDDTGERLARERVRYVVAILYSAYVMSGVHFFRCSDK